MKRRIFYSDNGTLTDWTTVLNRYDTSNVSFSLVAAEDYIYIASDLPFNHVYIKIDSSNKNEETSSIDYIEYWDKNDWRKVVEVIDETEVLDVALAQDGFITWTPDKEYKWTADDTKSNSGSITDLSSVTVYDRFWIRIKYTANFTASTGINWIGQLFCSENDLFSEFPELNNSNLFASWKTGKTNWEEQRVKASEVIVKDLKSKDIIQSRDQIIAREDLVLAATSKTAEIIMIPRGQSYEDERIRVNTEYRDRLNNSFPVIDKNANAIADKDEVIVKYGMLTR